MRVVLLVRDGPVARLLAHGVAASHELPLVVVESGRRARRGKLSRELSRGFPWRFPLTLLDLAALAVYQRLWLRYSRRRARTDPRSKQWPDSTIVRVDDVNDQSAIDLVRSQKPDVCLVFGTGILRGDALRVGKRYILNIHGGIVPYYRNVHSEFWALTRGDRGNIGVSVIHLDEGIDSGAVALRRRLAVKECDSLFAVRYRNGQLCVEAGMEVLATASLRSLPADPQDEAASGFFGTPGLLDLVGLWLKLRRCKANTT